MYVARASAGRLDVVLRPLSVEGELDGMGRLSGDLDLAGEGRLGDVLEGLGERDRRGVEDDAGSPGGGVGMSTTTALGAFC